MHEITQALNSYKLNDIFFGANGFSISDGSTIQGLQLGCSIHSDGSDLTGSKDGDWNKFWIVIGSDTEIGDPFFVDTSEPSLPVYTAMHGMGQWDAERISTSLSAFLEVLLFLNSISRQDFVRIAPDDDTIINPKELATIEKKLCEISGEEDYWKNFIEQHQEWVDEFGS